MLDAPAGAPHPKIDELLSLADSGASVVSVETTDLEWLEELAEGVAEARGMPALRWSLSGGLAPLNSLSGNTSLRGSEAILQHLMSATQAMVVVLVDMVYKLESPEVRAALRDLSRRSSSGASASHLILIPTLGEATPTSLKTYVTPFDAGLPSPSDLQLLLSEEGARWGARHQKRVTVSQAAADQLIANLKGLTRAEARRIFRSAIVNGSLGPEDLTPAIAAKHALLAQPGVLTFERGLQNLDEVAGLSNLKDWLRLRKDAFLAAEPPAGLKRPKGMLLLGVQGAGKTLSAKAVAGSWGVPLLKLDMGALYNKYHGESERNLRESLRAADVMSPCVLLIDEIEKGLASDDNDGLSKRLLGTLLSWMNDRQSSVFVVATSNDISKLPPEIMRKGRFDEIFFVGLPVAAVRSTAFRIHLQKHQRNPDLYDLSGLSELATGFTGAEIEQCVSSAAYLAHARGGELTNEDLQQAIRSTVPLSVTRADDLAALLHWAKDRTVPADAPSD